MKSPLLLSLALTLFFVLPRATGQNKDGDRPTPSTINVPDCFFLENAPDGSVKGYFEWIKTQNPNGTSSWKCAATATQGYAPAYAPTFTAVWTGPSSDEQFIHFEKEVKRSIVAAMKDTIVPKQELVQIVMEQLKEQGTWNELVKAVAEDLKKSPNIQNTAASVPQGK